VSWVRARVPIALVATFAGGLAAGVLVQRSVGIGNILRAIGFPPRSDRALAEVPDPAFEVPLAHRGRMLLFVLAGQSNMVGWAPMPQAADARTDDRVYVFGNDYRWRPGAEPVDDARGQVDQVSADPLAGYGPSLAFAVTSLRRNPEVVIGLIPCAKGASAIAEWTRDLSDQTLYGSCLKRTRAAGVMGEIAGVLFLQGEADALDPEQAPDARLHAEDWAERFGRLVLDLRDDLVEAELPVVFAQIGTTTALGAFSNWHLIKAQQASVRMPHVAMITTEDLPVFDGLHFTAESYRVIGERFAAAYWDLVERGPSE
jgi:hypothetical protein